MKPSGDTGTREWPIGGVYVTGGSRTSWGTGGEAKNFDADVVDVIFRPDARPALDTIEMHDYWNVTDPTSY